MRNNCNRSRSVHRFINMCRLHLSQRNNNDGKKEAEKQEKEKNTMTEPQQKDFEELLEQLEQEEETCESCPDRNAPADRCEGCSTHGNIQDLEQLIESMKEGEKRTMKAKYKAGKTRRQSDSREEV